jgi:hypothetical protein
MHRKMRLMFLLVAFVVIVGAISYFYPYWANGLSPISTSMNADRILRDREQIQITSQQLSMGEPIYTTGNAAVINVSVPNYGNYEGIVTGSADTQELSVQIADKVYTLGKGETKLIDINNDGVYDLEVVPEEISNGKLGFTMKKIEQKATTYQSFKDKLYSLFQKQSWLVLLVLVLLLGQVVYNLVSNHLMPWLALRKLKEREDPTDVLQYMLDQIRIAERRGDNLKVGNLVGRLQHFFDYLPEDVQKKALKMKDIERYIN